MSKRLYKRLGLQIRDETGSRRIRALQCFYGGNTKITYVRGNS